MHLLPGPHLPHRHQHANTFVVTPALSHTRVQVGARPGYAHTSDHTGQILLSCFALGRPLLVTVSRASKECRSNFAGRRRGVGALTEYVLGAGRRPHGWIRKGTRQLTSSFPTSAKYSRWLVFRQQRGTRCRRLRQFFDRHVCQSHCLCLLGPSALASTGLWLALLLLFSSPRHRSRDVLVFSPACHSGWHRKQHWASSRSVVFYFGIREI